MFGLDYAESFCDKNNQFVENETQVIILITDLLVFIKGFYDYILTLVYSVFYIKNGERLK